MLDYSKLLEIFEQKIGFKVDSDFDIKYSALPGREKTVYLQDLLLGWRNQFIDNSEGLDTLSLALTDEKEEYLIKRSLLYSSNVIYCGEEPILDEFGMSPYKRIPPKFVSLLSTYHSLIRNNVFCIIPDWKRIDSYEDVVEEQYFNPRDHNCITVNSRLPSFQPTTNNKAIHFKVFLPNVSNISLPDLAHFMENEEIFTSYHNTLNQLNLRNYELTSEQKLKEIVYTVDAQYRELNTKFNHLSSTRVWQSTKAVMGFSLAAFSILLPPEVATYVQGTLGTVSLFSAFDGVVGMIHTQNELKSNPYYFSYEVGKFNDKRKK